MIENFKIAVIGSGTMGNGIAHVAAQSGFETLLVDINEDQLKKALSTIEKNLDTVSTATSHGMTGNDRVILSVNSGTTETLPIKYKL